MSLGIFVTHFTCMVQRLASSMRPTKYASAASYRHIMVLPWKCRLYLPTSRAISRTSHEKGSFLIGSSVLFWNCQISQRATVPGQYFLVFLTLPAWRNSFQGALPPMLGQSFLWTGSSPKADGPASAAIWANCWVGNDDSDLPTSSIHLASSTCLSASSTIFSTSLTGQGFPAGDGWCTGEGGLLPFAASSFWSSFIQSTLLSSLSFPSVSLVLAILLNKQTDLVVNRKYCYKIQTTKWENYIKHKYLPIRKWHNFVLARFYIAAILNL